MPSQLCHIISGEEALSAVAPEASDALLWNAGALFRLGCQGPDIFYHSQRLKPVALHYGVLLHKRDYGRFVEAMAGYWRERDGDRLSPLAAYIAGFATHAALDRATHPYIIYFSGWVDRSRPDTERWHRCHAFFERVLDVLMLERRRGCEIADIDFRVELLPPGDFPATVVDAIDHSLRMIYPSQTEKDSFLAERIRNAFADALYFYFLTNPAMTSLKRPPGQLSKFVDERTDRRSVALLYPEDFARSVDYLNLGGCEWLHPCACGGSSRAGFLDLWEAAASETRAILTRLIGIFSGSAAPSGLGELIGNGGLSLSGPDGAACAPSRLAPLPLDEILDAQLKKRKEWIGA